MDKIDSLITALDRAGPASRDALDWAGLVLLQEPSLGGQIVMRLCKAEEEDPAFEQLSDLLGHTLDMARMDKENGRRRGDLFISEVNQAVGFAAARGRLTPSSRLSLSRHWSRSGLPAPSALEFPEADSPPARPGKMDLDRAASLKMLDRVLEDLIREAKGDAFLVHSALAETFPAMPADMRAELVRQIIVRPGPIHERLGGYWLLDSQAEIRQAAAGGLAGRLAEGALSAEMTETLRILRSWLPDDAARRQVDQILRQAIRQSERPGPPPAHSSVQSILATLPDGSGAQSFALLLKQGRTRRVAMVLLKQDHGVKDAYMIDCSSARDQAALAERFVDETAASPVSPGYLEAALRAALGDGFRNQRLPAPGLIDVAALCGLAELTPGEADPYGLLKATAAHARITGLPARDRRRLLAASRHWPQTHPALDSWFDANDQLHESLAETMEAGALSEVVWQWLETRRLWWAGLIARSATMLDAVDHPDADSFAAAALALYDGYDQRKIPVMQSVLDQTIDAWMLDDPFLPGSLDDALMAEIAPLPPPEPERRGELAKLLKGSEISPQWVDGFLTAAIIAPQMILPNQWLAVLLDAANPALKQSGLQRFLDLIMMRANTAVEGAQDATSLSRQLAGLKAEAASDWARGFGTGFETFRASWPERLSQNNKAMHKLIEDAAEDGFTEADAARIGTWINACHRVNLTAP